MWRETPFPSPLTCLCDTSARCRNSDYDTTLAREGYILLNERMGLISKPIDALPAASPACGRHRHPTPHQPARTALPGPGLPVSVTAAPSRLTVHGGGRGVSPSSQRPPLSRLPAVLLQAPQPLQTAGARLPAAPLTSLLSVLSSRGSFHPCCC